jgi:hypothetical protein
MADALAKLLARSQLYVNKHFTLRTINYSGQLQLVLLDLVTNLPDCLQCQCSFAGHSQLRLQPGLQ